MITNDKYLNNTNIPPFTFHYNPGLLHSSNDNLKLYPNMKTSHSSGNLSRSNNLLYNPEVFGEGEAEDVKREKYTLFQVKTESTLNNTILKPNH